MIIKVALRCVEPKLYTLIISFYFILLKFIYTIRLDYLIQMPHRQFRQTSDTIPHAYKSPALSFRLV